MKFESERWDDMLEYFDKLCLAISAVFSDTGETVYLGPLTLPWAIGIGLVLAAGAVLLYSVERRRLGILDFGILSVLRCAVIAVLLYFLMGPIIHDEGKHERKHSVVVLVDNSLSMTQKDRRLLPEDQLRVAIAKNLRPLTTKVSKASAADILPKIAKTLPKNPPRLELVKAVLTHPELNLDENIAKVGPIRPYLFGATLHGPKDAKDKKTPLQQLHDSISADEASTNLADAIHDIISRKDGDLPAAIIVMTDGRDNASKFQLYEVAEQCRDLGVELHIYGVGTGEGGSLQLREVGIPDTIFFDDHVQVPIRSRAQGYKNKTVEFTLELDGKPVFDAEGKEVKKGVPVRSGEDLRDVLTFVPRKGLKEQAEHLDFKVRVRLSDEPMGRDAALEAAGRLLKRKVMLKDSKIRVLFVEGSPRFEFKFLQTTLLRDRRLEVDFLLVNADEKILQSGRPYLPAFPPTKEKFFAAKYNLIIFGDVPLTKLDAKGNPSQVLTMEQMGWIQEFVKNRGGLIVMAGRQHMPASYVGSRKDYDPKTYKPKTPLEELLPVEVESGRPPLNPNERTQEYTPTLTAIGERTEWLALSESAEENRKLWETLPGFHWNYPENKLKKVGQEAAGLVGLRPGATQLVVNPRAKLGEVAMPVIALQNFGKGQVLYFNTDETWRWRFNVADKHYARFWGQVIYQMGLPHLLGDNAQRVQTALEGSEAVLGKPASVYMRLLDKDFNPIDKDQIIAVLKFVGGKTPDKEIKLQRDPDRPAGEYRGQLPHDKAGSYEIRLKDPDKLNIPTTPEILPYQFRVTPPPKHELEESGMAEGLLRQAALTSGGSFYREEDLHSLADNLKPRVTKFTRREEIDLFPLLLLVFVSFITLEWVVRKFADLS